PDLQNVGERLSREEILQSLVNPSAVIAEGFGNLDAASGMPPMGLVLSRRQIRDVVAFLSQLRGNRSALQGVTGQDAEEPEM
ncbi:MAG TPA: hypothetical protein VF190_03835, partial [Rhodothermales bacterium]